MHKEANFVYFYCCWAQKWLVFTYENCKKK